MNKDVNNSICFSKIINAESEKEIILYDRFNALISPLFKTLIGSAFQPELSAMYPKQTQAFIKAVKVLFKANKDLTDTTTSNDILQLIDYSEKAVAVIGDTKNIKEQFKIDGRYIGRFNKNLKVKGQSTAGWIFSKKHKDLLKSIVDGHNNDNNPFSSPSTTSNEETQEVVQNQPTQENLF